MITMRRGALRHLVVAVALLGVLHASVASARTEHSGATMVDLASARTPSTRSVVPAADLTTRAALGRFLALGAGPQPGVGSDDELARTMVSRVVALGGDLFLGGYFDSAGGVRVNGVARYSPATNSFSALGTGSVGVNGSVGDLVVVGHDLYLFGAFTEAGGMPARNAARYSPATNSFSALSEREQTDQGEVFQAVALDGSLYLFGAFTLPGEPVTTRFVRYSPATGSLTPVIGTLSGCGPDNDCEVTAMVVVGQDLYVGGRFDQIGDVRARNIARYSPATGAVSALAVEPLQPSEHVRSLETVGADLYLVVFTGHPVERLLRYSPTTAILTDLQVGRLGDWVEIQAIVGVGDEIYLGGRLGGGLARYRPNDQRIERIAAGPNDMVLTMATLDGDLYLGGLFNAAGDETVNYAVRYRPAAAGS